MSACLDWVRLSLLPGLGPTGLWRLIHRFGSPSEVLKQPLEKLKKVEGLQARQLKGFHAVKQCGEQAKYQLDNIGQAGGRVLSWDDSDYPGLLRQIPDPPPVLYVIGNVSLLTNCCVAMVGSRSATAYGRRIAASFAEKLSAAKVTVVSGLALGIDSEAHAGALAEAGSTVAVLGCGVDVVYPKQNKQLFGQIREYGLVVSEYPLGTRPEGFRFPARNRIIAGLSRGVVVVEAARKSGSLITAQLALDFGREVFAVPGQVDSFKSEGAHWLIQQGAQLVISTEDVINGVRFSHDFSEGSGGVAAEDSGEEIDPERARLLQVLEPYPQSLDEVLVKAELTVSKGSEHLLMLELDGLVEMGPGDLVRRI
ncbi:DNA-processing protein DprA [Desulfopila sp. IMCC35008]|uniref:DNA-processing protein DprA n=1 Tax=Desulfopila sp. IMCC35008 TaxID=2653858 RepID=UPI0013D02A6E|nr:DNA-processing protein DprA [Desulfopila sp. IMCC35008]